MRTPKHQILPFNTIFPCKESWLLRALLDLRTGEDRMRRQLSQINQQYRSKFIVTPTGQSEKLMVTWLELDFYRQYVTIHESIILSIKEKDAKSRECLLVTIHFIPNSKLWKREVEYYLVFPEGLFFFFRVSNSVSCWGKVPLYRNMSAGKWKG
jgi:hypothetical protein